MKIKISHRGNLELERRGDYKKQYCPHRDDDDPAPCGDWCPLFDEPITNPNYETPFTTVRLCLKELSCATQDFVDEREGKKSP